MKYLDYFPISQNVPKVHSTAEIFCMLSEMKADTHAVLCFQPCLKTSVINFEAQIIQTERQNEFSNGAFTFSAKYKHVSVVSSGECP